MELRLLLVQPEAAAGKGEARARVERLLRPRLERGEYNLVVLPEYLMGDPVVLGAEGVAAAAEPLDGPWSRFFEALAVEYGVHIVYTMYERSGSRRPYNTAVLVSPKGRLLVYRKTHLFDALGYRRAASSPPETSSAGSLTLEGLG